MMEIHFYHYTYIVIYADIYADLYNIISLSIFIKTFINQYDFVVFLSMLNVIFYVYSIYFWFNIILF